MKQVSAIDRPQQRMEVTAQESGATSEVRQALQNFSRVVREIVTQSGSAASSSRQQNIAQTFRDSLIPGISILEYPDQNGDPIIAMRCQLKTPGSGAGDTDVDVTFLKEGKSNYQMRIYSSTPAIVVQEPLQIKHPGEMTAIVQNISTQFDVEYQKTLAPTSESLFWGEGKTVNSADADDFMIITKSIKQTILKGEGADDDVVMVSPTITMPVENLSVSIRRGNTQDITKVMQWLKNNDALQPQQVFELLETEDPREDSHLIQALKQGNAEVARAYFYGLSELHVEGKISTEQFVKLMFGDNYSGLRIFIENYRESGINRLLSQHSLKELHNRVSLELSRHLMQNTPSGMEALKHDLNNIAKGLNADGKEWLNTVARTITTCAYQKDNDYQASATSGVERTRVFNSTLEWQSNLVKKGVMDSRFLIQTVKDILHSSGKPTESTLNDSVDNVLSILMKMMSFYRSQVISKSDLISLFQTTKTSAGEEFVLANYDSPEIIAMYFSILKEFYREETFLNGNLMRIFRNHDQQDIPQGPGLLNSLKSCSTETRHAFLDGLCSLSGSCITSSQVASLLEARDQQNISAVNKAMTDNNPAYVKEFFDQLLSVAQRKILTPACLEETAIGPSCNNTLLPVSRPIFNEASQEYVSGLFSLASKGILNKINLLERLQPFTKIPDGDSRLKEQFYQLSIALNIGIQSLPQPKGQDLVLNTVNKLFDFALGCADKNLGQNAMIQVVRGLKEFNPPRVTNNINAFLQKALTNPDVSPESHSNILDILLTMVNKEVLTASELDRIINHGEENHVPFINSAMTKIFTSSSQPSPDVEHSSEIITNIINTLFLMGNKSCISNQTLFKEIMGKTPQNITNLEMAANMNMEKVVKAFFHNMSTTSFTRKLSNEQILQLVTTINHEGTPLFSEILTRGDLKTQNACINGLYKFISDKNITLANLYDILQSVDTNGYKALTKALVDNKPEAISNYISRIKEAGFTKEQYMQLLKLPSLGSNSEFITQAGDKAFLDSHNEAWLCYCQSIEANARDLMLTPAQVRELTNITSAG